MSREKEGFRETIADLNRVFPEQGTLDHADVARFLGCSVRTVQRRIRFHPVTRRVTKADLARQISL